MSVKSRVRTGRVGAFAVAALLTLAVEAGATSIIVGSIDDGNCFPFMCNDSGTSVGTSIDYQQVYAASAFPGLTTINSIGFFFAPNFGGSSVVLDGTYQLYLSYAANGVGSLSSTLASNIKPGTQSLFASVSGGADTNPVWTIAGTPFTYDPSIGDLLLEVIASGQGIVPNSSGQGYNQADLAGTQTARAYCITGQSCAGNGLYGLVTEFDTVPVPEPGILVLLGAGLVGRFVAARRRRKSA